MAIKKTLQCEKCLAHKETTESALRFSRAPAWMLALGIIFTIFGGGGLTGAFYILKKWPTFTATYIPLFVVNGILGGLGLIFLILYIAKKIVAGRVFRCPKCGHRMVPVYHHHRT